MQHCLVSLGLPGTGVMGKGNTCCQILRNNNNKKVCIKVLPENIY